MQRQKSIAEYSRTAVLITKVRQVLTEQGLQLLASIEFCHALFRIMKFDFVNYLLSV
jgi:hypothetical protein